MSDILRMFSFDDGFCEWCNMRTDSASVVTVEGIMCVAINETFRDATADDKCFIVMFSRHGFTANIVDETHQYKITEK